MSKTFKVKFPLKNKLVNFTTVINNFFLESVINKLNELRTGKKLVFLGKESLQREHWKVRWYWLCGQP